MRLFIFTISCLLFFNQAVQASASESETSDTHTETSAGAVSDSYVVDRVLASVDGEPLTLGDLRRHVAASVDEPVELPAGDAERIREYVADLVVIRLLEKEAKSTGITVSDDEVAAYIEEIQRQNNVDREGFEALLGSRSLTVAQYSEQVKGDIMRTRLISARVRSKVSVTDEEILRYLDEQSHLKPEAGSVHLQQLLFKFNSVEETDRGQLGRHAAEIRESLVQGGSWSELGGDSYSDLGYVRAEDLLPSIQKIVSKLEPLEISEVLETAAGFYVFQVLSQSSDTEPIDQTTKEQVRQELYQEKFNAQLGRFLKEELPRKYHVEMKL